MRCQRGRVMLMTQVDLLRECVEPPLQRQRLLPIRHAGRRETDRERGARKDPS